MQAQYGDAKYYSFFTDVRDCTPLHPDGALLMFPRGRDSITSLTVIYLLTDFPSFEERARSAAEGLFRSRFSSAHHVPRDCFTQFTVNIFNWLQCAPAGSLLRYSKDSRNLWNTIVARPTRNIRFNYFHFCFFLKVVMASLFT